MAATKYLDYNGLLYFWTLIKGMFAKPSNANPQMDGTASAGSSALYSRGDHVHPSDTSKASKSSTTSAGSYGPSADASPAHGGTFKVPYVTVNAEGIVTGVADKTITLPASGNTDTKVKQNLTGTTDTTKYPLLLKYTGTATDSPAAESRYIAAATLQPSTGTIEATKFKGVLEGNADTATALATARNINVQDADGTNTGTAASFNGTDNATVRLPSTIKASLTGNASSASKVNSNLVLKIKTGTTEGTDLYTFNGSAGKTLDIKQGSNVTLTAAAGSLTIAATDTKYTAASAAPLMDGTAAVGSSAKYAREDHVHPSDTSKVDVVEGKGLSTNDFTDALETKLNGVAAGAQVNVIEGVKVNSTALTPSSKIVSIPNASTSAYGCTKLTSATNSTSESLAATAKAVKTAYDLANSKQSPATTLAGYGITDAYTKTEIDTKLTGGMHYKGSVQTVADLPASGNQTGDFYNVIATGENYAWDGSAWDQTGSMVDLQPITNAEIDTIVAS